MLHHSNITMTSPRKRINNGLIILNKGERIAVIHLLSLIVIFLGFSIFRPVINLNRNDKLAFHNLDSLIALQETALEEQRRLEEADTVSSATTTEPKKNSYDSKQKNYDSKQKKHSAQATRRQSPLPLATLDINLADSTELIALPQIGEVMASRIHRYRNRLGGFVCMEQLFEIKGMDSARFETIKPHITINKTVTSKINVNQDEFKTLLRHPYLEFEQVKAIVNYRERKGLIKDWQQLTSIVDDAHPLLKEYVTY